MVASVRHFKHYFTFTVLTFSESEGQVAHWIVQLQTFQYAIQHWLELANPMQTPCTEDDCTHCPWTETRER